MKWADEESPLSKWDDDITALIESASNELTVAEMVGALELQIHVLKNRAMGYVQKPKEPPQ